MGRVKRQRHRLFRIAALLPKDFDDLAAEEARYVNRIRERGAIATEDIDCEEELFSKSSGEG